MNDKKYYKVPTNALVPMLILAKPIYTKDKTLIAKENIRITWSLIEKLNVYDVDYVVVHESPNIEELADEIMYEDGASIPLKKELLHTKAPSTNQAFSNFVVAYNKHMDEVKSIFVKVEKGENITPEQVSEITESILESLENREDLFTYLSILAVKDSITYNHCLNVSLICNVFGHWLKLSDEDIKSLSTAGLLHDIGKLYIEEEVLNKVEPLTNIEFEKIKAHVLKSYKLVSNCNLDNRIKTAILMHHERLDGSGYMLGAKGDEISYFARILAIADMYDALTKDRPYRQKFSPLNVLYYLNSLITELDMDITHNVVYKIAKSYEGKKIKLNTEEYGEIVLVNEDSINKPIIKIDDQIIDLKHSQNLFVRDLVS